MAKPDRHFMNVFSAVLGILIAIALVLIGVSRLVDSGPKGARNAEDPLLQAEAHERIKPFGEVAVAGADNSALAIEAPPAPAGEAPVVAAAPASAAAAPADGKATYDMACSACHAAGIAGAPKVGDKAAWAARIAQGMSTLHQHAIKGYQGSAGVMPAKGGRADLSDDIVKAASEYMVSQSR
ncbi:MAG TPA: c-type cytochrome [Steroidobacteraceae bacterium]|nr:c-type cytochrome [Steroidobacteraceae bacterium]